MTGLIRPRYPLVAVGGGNPAVKLTLSDYGADDWDAAFGPGAHDAASERTGRRGNALAATAAWAREPWTRRCVDVRAKAVAGLPWGLYPAGTEPGDYEAALYTDRDGAPPPDLAVLAGVEGALYLIECALALTGRAYHLKLMTGAGQRVGGSRLGRFRGLQWVHPLLMEPKFGPTGVEAYVRTVNGHQHTIDAEAVLAVRQPDPFVEAGPGAADAGAAGMHGAALDSLAAFLSRYLDGGLIRQTLLSLDGSPTETQRKEVQTWWKRYIRRGDPADAKVVSSGVTATVLSEDIAGLSDGELTRAEREAVATAFGVPFSLLASSAANYATAEVDERGFISRTVVPQARLAERAFNAQLLDDYGLTFRFEPERHEVFQRYELEKAEKVVAVVGGPVMTVDEGRQLMGLPPMEAVDVVATEPEPDDAAGMDGATRALAALGALPEPAFRALAAALA